MNSLFHLILLASILVNVDSDSDVEIVDVTCAYNGDRRETCTIIYVDYQKERPNILNILNADVSKVTLHFKMKSGHYTVLPSNLFQLFPSLELLEISTELKAITKENFIGGSKLQILALSHNKITEIKAHTFDGMDKLKVIDLDTNKLTKVEYNAFAGAINLKRLKLSVNEIDTIEDGALNIPTLEDVDLSRNKLQTLTDDVFVGCPNLKSVHLSGNKLTRIGKSIDNVAKLGLVTFGNENDDVKIVDFDFYATARKPYLSHYTAYNVSLVLDDPASAANDDYTAEHLDIGGNRLSYPDILHRLRNFRNLTWLNIGSNNFATIKDIEHILEMFPKLHNFHFSQLPCKNEIIERLLMKFGNKFYLTDNQYFVSIEFL